MLIIVIFILILNYISYFYWILFFDHFEIQLLALKCLKISSLKISVDGVRFGLTKNVPAKTFVLANKV